MTRFLAILPPRHNSVTRDPKSKAWPSPTTPTTMSDVDSDSYDAAVTDEMPELMYDTPFAPCANPPDPMASLLELFPDILDAEAMTILDDVNGSVEAATTVLLEQRRLISASSEPAFVTQDRATVKLRPGHCVVTFTSAPTSLFEAVERDEAGVVCAMLAHGEDINAVDPYGRSVIMLAALWGARPSMLRLLLQAGANFAVKDRHGDTPFKEATRRGHTTLAEILRAASLEEKGRLRRRLRRTLIFAFRFGQLLVQAWFETISPGGRTYKRARLEFEGCRAAM